MTSPGVITLDAADRRVLEAIARSGRAEHRQVVRARIVLAAAGGQSNAGIARELRIVVDTVRTWRTRFCQHGLSGLRDRPRSGRPRVFAAAVVAEVKALACELPTQPGTSPRGHRSRYLRPGVALYRAPVAGPGRDQALATPLVDLSA
jgi:hypothetical protein